MKTTIANPRRLDILGNGDRLSDREIFTTILKRWRQKLGYCSILAAVPAILTSHISEARSDEAKKPEASVAERTAKRLKRLKLSLSNPALLKRQSEFRLPHQKGNFAMLPALAGNDDCPGRAIPNGTYTGTAPYIDSGDTTGANDTVTGIPSYYYYYYSYPAHGPDHIYSFALTALGPHPRIEVQTNSGTYRPLIYVFQGTCPAGTGNTVSALWGLSYSFNGLAAIDIGHLPLNVPFHLFVDSSFNDATGSGPYTLRMKDVTIGHAPILNQIDEAQFFARQHYLDFLNRQPDADGLSFWTNNITACGFDVNCTDVKRIDTSAAFFLSIEFQETGFLVYRSYKASFGNLPNAPVPLRLNEFLPDTQVIANGVIVNQAGWQALLETNKQLFFSIFVQAPRFSNAYPTSLTPEQLVDQLFLNAGVTPSATDRAAAINEFGGAFNTVDTAARARALRQVAENSSFKQQEFNRAFVLMQYFGYLRRNPNDAPEPLLNFDGYNFWLNKLNQFDGDFRDADMVKSFLLSTEYRHRFGP